jgi:hypothetical protein
MYVVVMQQMPHTQAAGKDDAGKDEVVDEQTFHSGSLPGRVRRWGSRVWGWLVVMAGFWCSR